MTPTECPYAPHGEFTTVTVTTSNVIGEFLCGPLHTYQWKHCAVCGEQVSAQCLLHPLVNGSCGEIPEPPEKWWEDMHV